MNKSNSLLTIIAALAALCCLTASQCQSTVDFPPYVAEICTDKIDNNGDGLIDCKDPTCVTKPSCALKVVINAVPATISQDTLVVSGVQQNATAIAVDVTLPGVAGTAAITADTWVCKLSTLTAKSTYTVRAIASDAEGNRDTATATFQRGN